MRVMAAKAKVNPPAAFASTAINKDSTVKSPSTVRMARRYPSALGERPAVAEQSWIIPSASRALPMFSVPMSAGSQGSIGVEGGH